MAGSEQKPGQDRGLPQRIRGAIDRTRGKNSPTPSDQVWGQYMEHKRDWRDLEGLVKDPTIQDEFQHKAIDTLLAPDTTRLPFPVNVITGTNSHLAISNVWVENVTGEQASYIAGRIPNLINEAGHLLQEEGNSLIAHDALFAYNHMIPSLLGKLPEDEAEKLFEHFSINDPSTFWGLDNSSGYNPLQEMYRNKDVDESWKRKAANQMHGIIEKEQSGESQPRTKYEDAAIRYSAVIESLVYDLQLPVSQQFFQDELSYMLTIDTGKPIVSRSRIFKVLQLLDDNDLAHRFARRQILPTSQSSHDNFNIYSELDADTAEMLIETLSQDEEIKDYLSQKLKEWQTRLAQNTRRRDEEQAKEQNLMSKMRR